MQVRDDALLLLRQSLVSLQEEVIARVLSNVVVGLVAVVVTCLLHKVLLELLLVDFLRLHADLDEHFYDLLKIDTLDSLTVALSFDLRQQQGDEPALDLRVEHDVLLELARLHVLHVLQVSLLLGKVLVHVEENFFDDANDLLLEGPLVRDLFEELFIGHCVEFLSNRLQHLDGRFLHVLVEHITMLVQHKVVACAVQLLIREGRRFLSVDFHNGVANRLPILRRLLVV